MAIANDGTRPKLIQQVPETGSFPISARLVSQTPGRIRLLVAQEFRQPEQMKRFASALSESIEIDRLRTNVVNGSITIFYNKERSDLAKISALLGDSGIVLENIFPEKATNLGKSFAAAELIAGAAQLNQQVKTASNGAIDLRFLIPLGFSALALRQLLVKGLQLGVIPWYVLGWYAFDSFIKFHYSSEPQLATEEDRPKSP
ncbi:MAG: hypothetical protein QNJ38_13920 [Prochloraceae cyanobacterium]|nr:hypothetical protein [Prochloraceae cyanobacterium]